MPDPQLGEAAEESLSSPSLSVGRSATPPATPPATALVPVDDAEAALTWRQKQAEIEALQQRSRGMMRAQAARLIPVTDVNGHSVPARGALDMATVASIIAEGAEALRGEEQAMARHQTSELQALLREVQEESDRRSRERADWQRQLRTLAEGRGRVELALVRVTQHAEEEVEAWHERWGAEQRQVVEERRKLRTSQQRQAKTVQELEQFEQRSEKDESEQSKRLEADLRDAKVKISEIRAAKTKVEGKLRQELQAEQQRFQRFQEEMNREQSAELQSVARVFEQESAELRSERATALQEARQASAARMRPEELQKFRVERDEFERAVAAAHEAVEESRVRETEEFQKQAQVFMQCEERAAQLSSAHERQDLQEQRTESDAADRRRQFRERELREARAKLELEAQLCETESQHVMHLRKELSAEATLQAACREDVEELRHALAARAIGASPEQPKARSEPNDAKAAEAAAFAEEALARSVLCDNVEQELARRAAEIQQLEAERRKFGQRLKAQKERLDEALSEQLELQHQAADRQSAEAKLKEQIRSLREERMQEKSSSRVQATKLQQRYRQAEDAQEQLRKSCRRELEAVERNAGKEERQQALSEKEACKERKPRRSSPVALQRREAREADGSNGENRSMELELRSRTRQLRAAEETQAAERRICEQEVTQLSRELQRRADSGDGSDDWMFAADLRRELHVERRRVAELQVAEQVEAERLSDLCELELGDLAQEVLEDVRRSRWVFRSVSPSSRSSPTRPSRAGSPGQTAAVPLTEALLSTMARRFRDAHQQLGDSHGSAPVIQQEVRRLQEENARLRRVQDPGRRTGSPVQRERQTEQSVEAEMISGSQRAGGSCSSSATPADPERLARAAQHLSAALDGETLGAELHEIIGLAAHLQEARQRERAELMEAHYRTRELLAQAHAQDNLAKTTEARVASLQVAIVELENQAHSEVRLRVDVERQLQEVLENLARERAQVRNPEWPMSEAHMARTLYAVRDEHEAERRQWQTEIQALRLEARAISAAPSSPDSMPLATSARLLSFSATLGKDSLAPLDSPTFSADAACSPTLSPPTPIAARMATDGQDGWREGSVRSSDEQAHPDTTIAMELLQAARDENSSDALPSPGAISLGQPNGVSENGSPFSALPPAEVDTAFQKAQVLSEAEHYAEAVPLLEHALALLQQLGPAHPGIEAEIWAHMGVAQQALGKVEEAVAAYSKAVEKDSSLHVCHANLASLFSFLERYEDASKHLSHALDLDPQNAMYLDLRSAMEVA